MDVGVDLGDLDVSGVEQRPPGKHGVGLGHLAAEELNGEAHGYAE
jgi:hypothetical protein